MANSSKSKSAAADGFDKILKSLCEEPWSIPPLPGPGFFFLNFQIPRIFDPAFDQIPDLAGGAANLEAGLIC